MPRARFGLTETGVRLTCTNEDGVKVVRDFYTSKNDETGYVFETGGRQVCEGLESTGRGLESFGDLEKVIRCEWFARKRDEQRARSRS